MRHFIAISAVLAWLFGAALLVVPANFYQPTGIAFTPMSATVAQAHGATLIGLGAVNWLARTSDARGIIGVLGGNLVVQVLSLYVVLHTMALGAGMAVVPGVVIHVVLGSLFGFFLVRTVRSSAVLKPPNNS